MELIPLRYFTSNTFTAVDFYIAAALFTSIIVIVAVCGKLVFKNDRKKLSWVIGSFSGLVMSILGILYVYHKVPLYNDFLFYGDNGPDLFEHTDDVANMASLFFGIANVLDLFFGCLFYRKELGILTAWVHHSLFIWISIASTTGNGLFMTNPPFASSFMFMCVEEIPTVVLGVGTLFPAFRTDWGFGIPFITTRVLYHGYITSYAIIMYFRGIGVSTHIPILYSLTFIMYFNWALGWVKMMMKKRKLKSKSKKSS